MHKVHRHRSKICTPRATVGAKNPLYNFSSNLMSRFLRLSFNYSLVHCSTKLAQAAPMSHVLSQAAGLGLAGGGIKGPATEF